MNISRRSFALGVGSAAVWPALGGLTTAAYAQSPVQGGTLRMFLNNPVVLVSAITSAGQVAQIAPKLFEGLVEYDHDMNIKPRMAKSVEMSDDAKTLTIVLREDLRWHDGAPINSADIAYSAMEVWSKFHPRGRSTFASLVAVETPDELTAVFTFSNPSAFVMNALFASEATVIPKHIYDGTDILKNPNNIAPVGSGPYKFVEWEQGEYILLEKNEDFWKKDEPYLDQVVVLLVSDESARAIAFESGEVDIAGGMPLSLADARRLEKLPHIEIPETGFEAYGNNSFIEVNLRRENLSDVRVRKAILHALDRDFLLEQVFFGFGSVATGPIPKTVSNFYSADVPTYAFDTDLASSLLDEAGYSPDGDGIRMKLTMDPLPYGSLFQTAAAYVKQALAVVGIEIEIRSGDFATYYKRVYGDNDFDLTMSLSSALTDPTIGVQRFFWSKNIIKGVPFSNGSGYSDPEVDGFLEDAAIEPDQEKRVELFNAFQKKVAEDLPVLPMIDVPYFAVKNARLKNTEVSPFGFGGSFSTAYFEE
ncbi:MAG: ABC transporter substrate-binding protein [Yoonia sp.]|uniref:ABC transporter substrate-binding protein n=1 Tax=Yoonia sp. TaxID=2212373 RepID=UPI003EFA0A75